MRSAHPCARLWLYADPPNVERTIKARAVHNSRVSTHPPATPVNVYVSKLRPAIVQLGFPSFPAGSSAG